MKSASKYIASSSPPSLACNLRVEARSLVLGVALSSEKPLADLAAGDEELEAFGDARVRSSDSRQRRDLDRVIDDEGRVPTACTSTTSSNDRTCSAARPCG
jgi:hypothetical protein